MKIFFRTQDLKRLEQLNEKQLYVLNSELCERASALKSLCMADQELIGELVKLAETAAKEIACRNRWSPIPSNGRYSSTGITYDTKEYRDWLIANRDTVCRRDFLKKFTFWEDLLSIELELSKLKITL